jgi:hypothetical protein
MSGNIVALYIPVTRSIRSAEPAHTPAQGIDQPDLRIVPQTRQQNQSRRLLPDKLPIAQLTVQAAAAAAVIGVASGIL